MCNVKTQKVQPLPNKYLLSHVNIKKMGKGEGLSNSCSEDKIKILKITSGRGPSACFGRSRTTFTCTASNAECIFTCLQSLSFLICRFAVYQNRWHLDVMGLGNEHILGWKLGQNIEMKIIFHIFQFTGIFLYIVLQCCFNRLHGKKTNSIQRAMKNIWHLDVMGLGMNPYSDGELDKTLK